MPWLRWLRREWAAEHGWLRVAVVIGGCLLMVALMGR